MHGVYVVFEWGYVLYMLYLINLFEHSYYIFMLQLHSYLTAKVLTIFFFCLREYKTMKARLNYFAK